MFYHMKLAKKELHNYNNIEYEIAVYRATEDGHLRGYVSGGGFSDKIAYMEGDTAADMKATGFDDPVDCLITNIKSEIDAGKLPTNVKS